MEPSPTPPPFIPSGNKNNQNNYDFIFNPPAKKKKGLLPGSNTPKERLLMAAVGGGVLLIILLLVIGMLFSGKSSTEALLDIAQRQTEIIRVSDLGLKKAKTSDARNLAINTKLTVQTSANFTLDRLEKLGEKIKPKTLALKTNTQTDQVLTNAGLNNKFDSTFVETLRSILTEYRQAVKKLYDTTSSQTEKQILAASFEGVTLLINQKIALD